MSFVLVIDDDVDSRSILATLLTVCGYSAVTAKNGLDALVLARKHLPSLILLDVMMPTMDGYGFRRAQREDPRIKDIPIVCVTGLDEADRHAKTIGAVGLLEKPFDIRKLVDLVSQHAGPPVRAI